MNEDELNANRVIETKCILVTGPDGFVGSRLCQELVDRKHCVRGAQRISAPLVEGCESVVVGDIYGQTDWGGALAEIDVVIHLAARVHVMNETVIDPLAAFRMVNVDGTKKLAREAARAGVKRFIFISSVKVNGETTSIGKPFTADDSPHPIDPYGISKYEAENGLRLLATETGMNFVIIRPPLVYGPGVKANFLRMLQLLKRGVPLPLGAIHNKRSLVALENLNDLIVTCIDHPAAANQVFLAGDGEDFSTTELLKCLASGLGKTPRLLPVPMPLLEKGSLILGKRSLYQRLCGSLQVDITKNYRLLNWSPPVSAEDALNNTAWHFLNDESQR